MGKKNADDVLIKIQNNLIEFAEEFDEYGDVYKFVDDAIDNISKALDKLEKTRRNK